MSGGRRRLGMLCLGATAWFVTPIAAQQPGGSAADEAGEKVVVVRITDDGFRPSTVTVDYGTIVRYLQLSDAPHNVEFVRVPEGTRMVPEYVPGLPRDESAPTAMPPLRFGPYLIAAGEAYDVRIDDYLAEGVYEDRCASHGHRGLLLILGSG